MSWIQKDCGISDPVYPGETARQIAEIREAAVIEKQRSSTELAEYRRKLSQDRAMLAEGNSSELAESQARAAREKEALAMQVAEARTAAAQRIDEIQMSVVKEEKRIRMRADSIRQAVNEEMIALISKSEAARQDAALQVNQAKAKAAVDIVSAQESSQAKILEIRKAMQQDLELLQMRQDSIRKASNDEVLRIREFTANELKASEEVLEKARQNQALAVQAAKEKAAARIQDARFRLSNARLR
ncbi:MAG: hypothetical protein IPJ06_09855 [Saprospiraceae bacterium]|nr:hypothetical protein [Saprospiraceae bacterium]